LEEINKFSSLLLDNSPMPILVTNPDSSIRYANKAVVKLTGFTAAELIGTKVPYPFWPKDRQIEYLAEIERDTFNKKRILEKTFINKQGKEFWVEMTLIPVKVNRQLKYIISTWINLTEEKKLRKELELYSRRMMEMLETERKRIADELHDDTAQSLAILSLELDSLSRYGEFQNEKILEKLKHLREDVRRTMQTIRQYSYDLRPGMLEHLGLESALEQLADEISEKSQIEIQFEASGRERELPNETRIALFRIAQEALRNVVRHSQATASRIIFRSTPRRTRLIITDNGRGFDLNQEKESALRGKNLGLVGMREWAKLINADLKIESTPNYGTKITVEVNAR
jgi:PAS domain S-box-containing protein